MSALDVIPIPGHPGKYARRAFVEAWQEAGSPPLNSAGRLYAEQKDFYDGYRAGKPGYAPADNPDDESQKLAHVRFVAGDIDPTPDRVRRLAAAGLARPYSYEPWHWELPNVRSYAIVRSIPTAAGNATPAPFIPLFEEDEMRIIKDQVGTYWLVKPNELRGIDGPQHLELLRRVLTSKSTPGAKVPTEDLFNAREIDIIKTYFP